MNNKTDISNQKNGLRLGGVAPRLSKIQQNQLNRMEIDRWYKDYEVGNGKTMQALVDKGLVEFIDKEIIDFGDYKPWKYDKEFRRVS